MEQAITWALTVAWVLFGPLVAAAGPGLAALLALILLALSGELPLG